MRRFLPRALVAAAVTVSTAACAAGGVGVGLEEGSQPGGRYLVMVPDLTTQGVDAGVGAEVAEDLRGLIVTLPTHTAVSRGAIQGAMKQYNVEQLSEITARQLAQQVRVPLVSWGEVEQGGAGLQADVKFIDVGSGTEILIEDVSAADPTTLAQNIFQEFSQKLEGIRQAAFCNDYLSSDQYERALENCNQALAVVPTSTSALYGKATALLNLERPEEALETYQKLLEIDPANQDALYGAGLAASQLGQSALAREFYNRYLELNPTDVAVRLSVAGDIAQTGDYVNAFAVLEPAIAENADDVDFQKYLFGVATAAGQKVKEQEGAEAARRYFETAMSAYQDVYGTGEVELDVSALRQAIAVTNELGQREESLVLARQATERFDTVPAIWSQYAQVLADQEQYQEAVQALTRLADLDPEYENVFIRRAQNYLRAGNRAAAVADLRRAAERGKAEVAGQILAAEASQAFQNNRYDLAAELAEMAAQYAEGETRGTANFIWGFSLIRQGEAIAKANTEGRAEPARRALALFERGLERVRQSGHPSVPQVVSFANQYIENQRAIIEASR